MAQKQANNQKSSMTPIIIFLVAAVAIVVAVAVAMTVSLFSIPEETQPSTTATETQAPNPEMETIKGEINSMKASDFSESADKTEYVKITVAGHGDIILRLRSDYAPITVENFQKLVGQKFYDGLTFHRVMKNFMIQGGDPDGTGSSPDKIKGEFSANGVKNDLRHIDGVISMARGSYDMDSASCQFFICNSSSSSVSNLDGSYAAFGYVVAGLDVVDSISDIEVKANSRGEMSVPVDTVTIEKICFVKKN